MHTQGKIIEDLDISHTVRDLDITSFVNRSRPIDLTGVAWNQVTQYPFSSDTIRTLQYMHEVECHTIVFPRTIFSARAVNDEVIGRFLTCWLYEESFHGPALARFLEVAGYGALPKPPSRFIPTDRLAAIITPVLAALWSDFLALHMAWGAIHELTTITAYHRLAARSGHPILTELLKRLIREESRHFAFYYAQAKQRLKRPQTASITRFLLERLWSPVGHGVQSEEDEHFVIDYLFASDRGRLAARRIDDTIRRLPGFTNISLLEAWIDRRVGCWTKP